MRFYHHPDNLVYIDDLCVPLDWFLLQEPDYAIPEGSIARLYDGDRHILYSHDSQWAGALPWGEGDQYIANHSVYAAAWEQYLNQPPSYSTIAAAKAAVTRQINALADAKYYEVIAQYPALEPLKWSYTLGEAQAIVASAPDQYSVVAPNLVIEAQTRQIDPLVFAQTVLTKSAQFRQRCAEIAGNRGRHADAVQALTTIAQVAAYDYSGGW